MLSQNVQFVWSYIAAKHQSNIELLPTDIEDSSNFAEMTPRVVSKQEDDYFFSNDAVQSIAERSLTNRPQLMSLDSTINFEGADEDAFTVEQTKLLENLMKIVDFVLK